MAETPSTPTSAPKQKISSRIRQQLAGASIKKATADKTAAEGRLSGLQRQLEAAQSDFDTYKAGGAGEDWRVMDSTISGQDIYNQNLRQRQSDIRRLQGDIAGVQSNISGLQANIDDPSRMLSAKDKALLKGAEFGESVLGEEGLGRLGTDPEIQAAMERTKRESEQGLSAAEFAAQRSQAFEGIDRAGQTASRGLQARLARMGVKGATAGTQLAGIELGTLKEKAGVERDLFLKSADVQRSAFKDFKQSLGQVKSFDLAQKAKETDIVMQSAFGQQRIQSAEKIAELQAEAQRQAAIARQGAVRSSCWGAGSLVLMQDGSVKAIEQIKLGDITKHGVVTGRTQHLVPNSEIVSVDGIMVVGCHPLLEVDRWIESKESVLAVSELEEAKNVVVYDLIVENYRVEIRGNTGHTYLFTDYNGHDMTDENERLLEELNESLQRIPEREIQ